MHPQIDLFDDKARPRVGQQLILRYDIAGTADQQPKDIQRAAAQLDWHSIPFKQPRLVVKGERSKGGDACIVRCPHAGSRQKRSLFQVQSLALTLVDGWPATITVPRSPPSSFLFSRGTAENCHHLCRCNIEIGRLSVREVAALLAICNDGSGGIRRCGKPLIRANCPIQPCSLLTARPGRRSCPLPACGVPSGEFPQRKQPVTALNNT